jgi:metal-dependent hydrolase (beta-lactamase superfamily II)
MDRRRPRVALLALIFACQLACLGYVLYIFAEPPGHVKMYLEEKPTLSPTEVIIPLSETLNTASLFAGGEFLGRAPGANLFRQSLAWDEGQFMWIILKGKVRDSDLLLRLIRKNPMEDITLQKEPFQDGIINFFYDLSGREDLFRNNWGAVGVKELQVSAIMPWTKKLDFIVLSSLRSDHLAGLSFIARLHPTLTIFTPPLPRQLAYPPSDSEGEGFRSLRKFTNLTPLGAGHWRLTEQLRALVIPLGGGTWGVRHELVLIIKGKEGWSVLAGSGFSRPLALVRKARLAVKSRIRLYAGGTGMMIGSGDPALKRELEVLRQEEPSLVIVPNYSTSPAAHDYLREIFGKNYRPGCLGERLKL